MSEELWTSDSTRAGTRSLTRFVGLPFPPQAVVDVIDDPALRTMAPASICGGTTAHGSGDWRVTDFVAPFLPERARRGLARVGAPDLFSPEQEGAALVDGQDAPPPRLLSAQAVREAVGLQTP